MVNGYHLKHSSHTDDLNKISFISYFWRIWIYLYHGCIYSLWNIFFGWLYDKIQNFWVCKTLFQGWCNLSRLVLFYTLIKITSLVENVSVGIVCIYTQIWCKLTLQKMRNFSKNRLKILIRKFSISIWSKICILFPLIFRVLKFV